MIKYTSKYTDKQITASQFLAEAICEKIARKEKRDLFNKFWNNSYWAKEFKKQVILASRLLKTYSVKSILYALNHRRSYKVYSLGAKYILEPLMKEQEKKSNLKIEPKITVSNDNKDVRPFFQKKNRILDL